VKPTVGDNLTESSQLYRSIGATLLLEFVKRNSAREVSATGSFGCFEAGRTRTLVFLEHVIVLVIVALEVTRVTDQWPNFFRERLLDLTRVQLACISIWIRSVVRVGFGATR